MPRQREPRLMQFRRGRVELLTACPRGADLNPKHSPDRHHSNASHRLANEAKRREPKSGRIPGEQILSSTDAFIRAESWTNLGPNSAHRILKGLGSSNPPPLRHTVWQVSLHFGEAMKSARGARFTRGRGPGECHRAQLTAKIAQNSLFAILACPSASRPTSCGNPVRT